MGLKSRKTILFLTTLILGVLLLWGCQDFSKGAVLENDGLSTYLFDKSVYNLTWLLSPRKLHKIKYAIKTASKNTVLGDTVYVDLQSLFKEKIDRIYYYYGWRPASVLAENMGVDYTASCIPERVARIILISNDRVIYHEDFPKDKGYLLIEGYDSKSYNYEGNFSSIVGVSPQIKSFWTDFAVDYCGNITQLDSPKLIEYETLLVLFWGNDHNDLVQ